VASSEWRVASCELRGLFRLADETAESRDNAPSRLDVRSGLPSPHRSGERARERGLSSAFAPERAPLSLTLSPRGGERGLILHARCNLQHVRLCQPKTLPQAAKSAQLATRQLATEHVPPAANVRATGHWPLATSPETSPQAGNSRATRYSQLATSRGPPATGYSPLLGNSQPHGPRATGHGPHATPYTRAPCSTSAPSVRRRSTSTSRF
jgi:hypothetical protein